MTVQVRKSVFETNSSSSHSLTVAPGDLVDTPFDQSTLRSGLVEVRLGEYGWEWHRYYLARNKLDYLFTQVTQGNLPRGLGDRELTDRLLEDKPRLAMLAKVVKEHTGCELLFIANSGYIDHDSVGVGMELFNDEEGLKAFLFNSQACIQTGNDNDPPPFEILTDRGAEYFYADKVVPAPPDYVAVELQVSRRGPEGLRTGRGALLTAEELHPELYAELLQQMVVTCAHFDEVGSWDPFEHRSVSAEAARELNRLGVKLSPTFYAGHTFHKTENGYDQELRITAKVPAQLAKQLQDLPKTPAVLLKLVDTLVAYERKRNFLSQADWLDAEGLARCEKELQGVADKVDQLCDKAAAAGVLF